MDSEHAAVEQLSALLDGELGDDEARTVEAHVADCAGCRADLERLRATVSLLRATPFLAPPRSFLLPRPQPARASLLRFPWLPRSPLALRSLAAVAAALTLVLFLADPLLRPDQYVAVQPSLSAPAAGGGSGAAEQSRQVVPQAGPGVSTGAPAQADSPRVDNAERSGAQPSNDRTGVVGAPLPRPREPAGAADAAARWLTPSRLLAVALAATAFTLLAVSFLGARKA